jgi:hypothetical protein
MKFNIILFFTVGNLNILVAQNDFVVTNKNDTIYGQVITTTFNGFITGDAKIKYTDKDGKKNSDTFSANGLKGYYKDGLFYETQMLDQKDINGQVVKIFVRKVVNGHLSLFSKESTEYRGPTASTSVAYFFKKADEIYLTSARPSQKKLLKYFDNCQEVKNAIINKTISTKDFKSMVSLYNGNCAPY